jgi:hypothetical protein
LLRQPWVESRKNMDISPRNTGTKPWKWWSKANSCHFPPVYVEMRWTIYISVWRAICFCFFFLFCGRFCIFFGFLVLCFPASLLFYFPCFSAFVLLCLSTLLFYMFFFLVMCFCCSTSCSSASLLPVFTASLFFLFFCFILSCLYPRWSPKDPRWNPKKP